MIEPLTSQIESNLKENCLILDKKKENICEIVATFAWEDEVQMRRCSGALGDHSSSLFPITCSEASNGSQRAMK